MGASAQSFNGALPGLSLKAWAQFSAAGALIKSSNVTSITKGAAGIYTLNFTSALSTTTYLFRLTAYGKDGSQTAPTTPTCLFENGAKTTSAGAFTIYHNATATDLPGFIEVYE